VVPILRPPRQHEFTRGNARAANRCRIGSRCRLLHRRRSLAVDNRSSGDGDRARYRCSYRAAESCARGADSTAPFGLVLGAQPLEDPAPEFPARELQARHFRNRNQAVPHRDPVHQLAWRCGDDDSRRARIQTWPSGCVRRCPDACQAGRLVEVGERCG
jgi:hypothetical protein